MKYEFMSRNKPARSLDIDDAIEKFLEAKKRERRSVRTIKTYREELARFRKWFVSNSADKFDKETLESYISYLTFDKRRWDDHPTNPTNGAGLSSRTINNTIRILRVFSNYLVGEKMISESPAQTVRYQTEEEKEFECFSPEQVNAILKVPNRKTYTGFRDYVVMLVLYDTGLRIGELTALRVYDLDFASQQIIVRGEVSKTKRLRTIPLAKKTAEELHHLVEFCGLDRDDYVWLTQFGERMKGDNFAKMLKRYGEKANVTGVRVSPHTFRHTFAVHYLMNGGDPFSLQKFLGHTSMDMVSVYMRFSKHDLHALHAKSSPVENMTPSRKKGEKKFR